MNIVNALASGHGATAILAAIAAAFPSLHKRIKQAQKMGHNLEDILKVFQGMSQKQLSELDQEAATSENPLMRATEATRVTSGQEFQKKAYPAIGKAALTAAAGYAATRAFPYVQQALQRAGINLPIGPTPMGNAPTTPPQVPPVPQGGAPAAIQAGQAAPAVAQQAQAQTFSPPTAQPTPQPPSIPPQKQKAAQFLRSINAEQRVEELARQGKTPEEIASDIQMEMHPASRKAYAAKRARGEERPIAEHVKEFLTTPEGFLREGIVEFGKTPTVKETLQVEEPPEEPEFTEPKKGAEVLDRKTGQVGVLKDAKEKEALLESDGKIHKVEKTDLITSPIEKKDLADLFDELNSEIEKESGEEVSRAVRLAAYYPDKNLFLFIPWEGRPYLYDEISEEDKDFLMNTLQKRRTTGESVIGAWQEGTKSVLGSKMHDFIKKLQKERGGKGNEYMARFEFLYDPHQAAIQAKKLKKRKK